MTSLWVAARALAAALHTAYMPHRTAAQWRRPARTCPTWCARDHRCTAQRGYPSGEHRSAPHTYRAGYGALVATRVQTITGQSRLDLRLTVRLDRDDQVAAHQARLLLAGIDLTIRAILTTPTTRPALCAEVNR
jgi:hypothetical protein